MGHKLEINLTDNFYNCWRTDPIILWFNEPYISQQNLEYQIFEFRGQATIQEFIVFYILE